MFRSDDFGQQAVTVWTPNRLVGATRRPPALAMMIEFQQRSTSEEVR